MTRINKRKRLFTSLVCSMLAVAFLFASFVSAMGSTSIVARADDSAKETLNNAARDYGAESTPEGFEETFKKMEKETREGLNPNTFGYVLNRLISTGYINHTPQAVAESGRSLPPGGYNCDVNARGAGTLVYHNCDVPSITTEFIQDAAGLFIASGPQSANVGSATVDNRWFGLPSNIPGDSVPVDPNLRSVKYTALEIYGYNLKYTGYAGEWDHIKVLTSARSLANFGFMDDLKLSVKSIVNGITAGVGLGLQNAAASLSDGDIFGAIGGAFSGFFNGAASGTVNTILDTSDLNVMNSIAWYRLKYGSTAYNARSLTQEEIGALAKSEFLNMLSASEPAEAQVPQDLANIATLPADPKTAISKCVYKSASGSMVEYGNVSRSPGPSEEDCRTMATSAYEQRQSEEEPPENDRIDFDWSVDGTQKLETLEEWRNNNSGHFSTAEKYGMSCTLDTNEANRANSLASLRACWSEEHAAAVLRKLTEIQNSNNNEWAEEKVDPEAVAEWMASGNGTNFNAPWERYVCVDANGKDMLQNGQFVKPYNSAGEHNPACGPLRSPIQNGLFGNGYENNQTQPAIDTRYELLDKSIFSVIYPLDSVLNATANFGLGTAVLTTRISNTVMNLTFSPILETLGLTDKIEEIIVGLRDSLFFPLAVVVIGISAVMILWKVGKEKNYGAQVVSIGLMVLTFMSGVFLMYRPDLVLKTVDEVPAMVEQAIVGSIFSFGNSSSDHICSATGTIEGPKGTDLEGQKVDFDPMASTRSLMCENWRVFSFTPYIYGQWGTGYDNLYANNTSNPNKMQNTNGNLVGNATVKMGAGTTVNNWGLYQLDVLTSGTSTNRNFEDRTGFVSRDFYRIVDMQAGPNNGAGTDSRYLESWSGNNGFGRAMVGLVSGIVGIIGMVTIVSFSFAKIQITLVTTIMLIFLPIMFLIGLHPTIGRGKLKTYIGTLLGLMIQRIVLVTMLAVMFKVIIGIGNAATGYLLIAFATSAACIMFMMYRKQIMALIDKSFSDGFGGSFGGRFGSDPQGAIADNTPTAIKNYAQIGRSAAIGATSGAIGGYLSGRGAFKGATESAKWELQSLRNRQAFRGLPTGQALARGMRQGEQAAMSAAAQSADYQITSDAVFRDTDLGYDQRVGKMLSDDLEDLNPGDDTSEIDPGLYNRKLLTGHTAKTSRMVSRLTEIERELGDLSLNQDSLDERKDRYAKDLNSTDINSIVEGQNELRHRKANPVEDEEELDEDSIEVKKDKLNDEKAKLEKALIERENRSYTRGKNSDDMKNELRRLVNQAEKAIDEIHRG